MKGLYLYPYLRRNLAFWGYCLCCVKCSCTSKGNLNSKYRRSKHHNIDASSLSPVTSVHQVCRRVGSMSKDMVDYHQSRREHGKKRHHHHRQTLIDDNTDTHSSKTKRSDDYSPSPERDDDHRSHHHKTKRHKHEREDQGLCRSRHRSSPKESRTEKYHKVRIKEEPSSPKRNEESSKSRPSKDRTFQSSGRRRHNEGSPDADVLKRNNRDHSSDSSSRGNRQDEQKRDTASKSNQNTRKGKSKLGTYSPSDDKYEWGKKTEEESNKPPTEKQKPNFGLSGKLTEDTNMYNGVVIKYSEPPEARKPKRRWRLYPFKGDQALPMMHIHRQSAFLMGRDRKVVDIPIDHPSCSKQHAALQYRLVPYQREDGATGKRIKLYIIDLESANGTFVNNNKIEPRKYVELIERDVIKFGYSSREYVLLHEGSKDEDDVE